MGFLLDEASETVCTQYLHQPQVDEIRLVGVEFDFFGIDELLQLLFVVLDEFIADILRNLCFHLIKQGNHIIIEWAFAPALEVDEIQLSILHHDVPGLEISVHEEVARRLADEVGEGVEVIVQAGLVEVDFLVRLHEIIFEVVEVGQNRLPVEVLGRVGLAVVQPLMTNALELYQMLQSPFVEIDYILAQGPRRSLSLSKGRRADR